jgi:hypothetical protein
MKLLKVFGITTGLLLVSQVTLAQIPQLAADYDAVKDFSIQSKPERSLVLWLLDLLGNSTNSLHVGRHRRRLHSRRKRVVGTSRLRHSVACGYA